MKKLLSIFTTSFVILMTTSVLAGQRRRPVVVRRPATAQRTVVVRRPATNTRLAVHKAHPIRRTLPNSVVVHPARKTVVVGAPLVYLPGVIWTRTVVTVPARERLVWQDSESIASHEGWVDLNFGVDNSGNALLLDINGRARLKFAEVVFSNGNVQVVDFNEQTQAAGIYQLLDFANRRHVSTVRVLAKSESPDTTMVIYLSK